MQIQNIDILIVGSDCDVGPIHFYPCRNVPAEERIQGLDILNALVLGQKLVQPDFHPPLVPS